MALHEEDVRGGEARPVPRALVALAQVVVGGERDDVRIQRHVLARAAGGDLLRQGRQRLVQARLLVVLVGVGV